MFLTIKRKNIALFFICIFLIGLILSIALQLTSSKTNSSPYNITIVLDAGHGGVDGGSVGVTTNVKESTINLIYAEKIEDYLKAFGVNVVQTRTTDNGLYDYYDNDFKIRDMEKRKEIIENSNAQLVVSIHMNKFSDGSQNGSQVFFGSENDNSENLANDIRNELVKRFDNARPLTLLGDYYITSCSNIPTVIVECGFLSNQQDEINLQNEEYQNKMCYAIFCGIARYVLTNYNLQ